MSKKMSKKTWNPGEPKMGKERIIVAPENCIFKRSEPFFKIPAGLVLGVDPGFSGALVSTNGNDIFEFSRMPVKKSGHFGEKEIHAETVRGYLDSFCREDTWIFCERAIPMAMGARSAFVYGRHFQTLVGVISERKNVGGYEFVEPSKWTKVIHEGISKDLRPKAKSQKAVKKWCPQFIPFIPKNRNGLMDDGVVDALLIAIYGLLTIKASNEDVGDF